VPEQVASIEEADVVRLARVAGFTIDPAFRAGVARNLGVLLAQADLLMTPPLDAVIEPAPVFRA
jgi:hypothetical protein